MWILRSLSIYVTLFNTVTHSKHVPAVTFGLAYLTDTRMSNVTSTSIEDTLSRPPSLRNNIQSAKMRSRLPPPLKRGWKAELRAKQNAWELSGGYEGDIILNRKRKKVRYWKNKELPYEISPTFSRKHKDIILRALEYLRNKTCVKPIPRRKGDMFGVLFLDTPGRGCKSSIGCIRENQQKIYLSPSENCLHFGIVLHEILHTLGLWHQHTTEDRDDYITIVWENIEAGQEYNFSDKNRGSVSSFGFKYDYDSIMHYDAFAYSRNGGKTIIPKYPEGARIGQLERLSEIDIAKLGKMYKC